VRLVIALVIAAAVGFGIYKAFIDPSYVTDQGLSRESTEECVDESANLEVNSDVTAQLAETTPFPMLVVQREADEAVIVLFLSSESDAVDARDELADSVGEQFGEEFRDDVTQRDSLVVAHPGISLQDVAGSYGTCVIEVSNNRWGGWIGIDTKTVSRPFASN
jgi:hypothetical protein